MHSIGWCKAKFENILNCLGMTHQCDRQMDRLYDSKCHTLLHCVAKNKSQNSKNYPTTYCLITDFAHNFRHFKVLICVNITN